MSDKPEEPARIMSGHLFPFSDQGTEGTYWMFAEEGKQGWDAIHRIDQGDLLMVFNDAARQEPIWQGRIDYDYEINKKPNWMRPDWILQQIDGIGTVHGIQKGVEPDFWGSLFIEEKPAVLVPMKVKPQP